MKRQRLLLIIGLFAVLGYVTAPAPVFAQVKEICTNGVDDDGDKAIDCADSDCDKDPACVITPPPPKDLCHNIGGPDAKGGGANCDPNTDQPCCIETEEIGLLCIDSTQYFGHLVSASDNAFASHVKHGDGEATEIFDPPLHLSSTGQNHLGANVECLADRVNEQD